MLLKGGQFKDDKIREALIGQSEVYHFEKRRKNFEYQHGTGCTLSTAGSCFLGENESILNSCRLASDYLDEHYYLCRISFENGCFTLYKWASACEDVHFSKIQSPLTFVDVHFTRTQLPRSFTNAHCCGTLPLRSFENAGFSHSQCPYFFGNAHCCCTLPLRSFKNAGFSHTKDLYFFVDAHFCNTHMPRSFENATLVYSVSPVSYENFQ
ncbi:bifunctional hydroxymethylpyrimidine kinase/phosphomethylpyrimidine kinase [Labilibaculum manganireducens]|uniref:bifunctional hydroxymethylpyrimidine kinase/phosphomethylpyrimidine kinase n=1 Tax=Labilibaculum manganireducens TaxID=1940525 RepID=UPI003CCBD731